MVYSRHRGSGAGTHPTGGGRPSLLSAKVASFTPSTNSPSGLSANAPSFPPASNSGSQPGTDYFGPTVSPSGLSATSPSFSPAPSSGSSSKAAGSGRPRSSSSLGSMKDSLWSSTSSPSKVSKTSPSLSEESVSYSNNLSVMGSLEESLGTLNSSPKEPSNGLSQSPSTATAVVPQEHILSPANTADPRSYPSFSGDTDCKSPPSIPETASPKISVKSFAKSLAKATKTPSRSISKCDSDCCLGNVDRDAIPEDTCYIPSPLITFLVDEVDYLVCQICCTSKMGLHERTIKIIDTQPASLPCGHVYGYRCLIKWFRCHDVCPTCRMSLRHSGCNHKVEPHVLDMENILSVPKTIPEGGVLDEFCRPCRLKQDEEHEIHSFHQLKREFREARALYHVVKTAEAKKAMMALRGKFENLPKESRRRRIKSIFGIW
ncbi:hypothetical protein BJ170DRAFT_614920 [Xylariales sp. AK1849]|nr:hypothetical protein BJ170DRAFT_614920 [Xylariales sp. AK1849]